MVGVLGEPGIFPESAASQTPSSRDELLRRAADRFERATRGLDPNASGLWDGASAQVAKKWLAVPFSFNAQGNLRINGEAARANPAFRFGVQQADKLRAVSNFKKGLSSEATFISTPINLPSWGHIAQMRFVRPKGGSRPLAVAKADHADAYEQLSLRTEVELAAAATLRKVRLHT